MITKRLNKKLIALFLTLVMVVASTGVVSAGCESMPVPLGFGYVATYEAYCYDEYGGASTYIYVEDGIETHVEAGVALFVADNDTGAVTCAGTRYDYDDWTVDVVMEGIDTLIYTGHYVNTEHSVAVVHGLVLSNNDVHYARNY